MPLADTERNARLGDTESNQCAAVLEKAKAFSVLPGREASAITTNLERFLLFLTSYNSAVMFLIFLVNFGDD